MPDYETDWTPSKLAQASYHEERSKPRRWTIYVDHNGRAQDASTMTAEAKEQYGVEVVEASEYERVKAEFGNRFGRLGEAIGTAARAEAERDAAIEEAEQLREARDEAFDGTTINYLRERCEALSAVLREIAIALKTSRVGWLTAVLPPNTDKVPELERRLVELGDLARAALETASQQPQREAELCGEGLAMCGDIWCHLPKGHAGDHDAAPNEGDDG